MMVAAPERAVDFSAAADVVHAVNPWVALAYLVAGVCFILALRGLSSPATSQRGNRFGMVGMAIAVATTLFTQAFGSLGGFEFALGFDRENYLTSLGEIL